MSNGDDIKKLQDENKTLKDTITSLTSEKGKAETEKVIAEAQRAAILAQLPPSDTKALEGKVSVDASAVTGIQTQAHKAMSELVHKMAGEIVSAFPGLKTVVLYNERDFAPLAYYRTVKNELSLLNDGYHAALKKKVPAALPNAEMAFATMAALPLIAPAVAGAAIKSVIDLVALFRTNVDIKGAAVTFDDASIVAEVAKHLRAVYMRNNGHRQAPHDGETSSSGKEKAHGKTSIHFEVIYSTLSIPGLFITHDYKNSKLLEDIGLVAAMRQQAEIAVAAFDAKDADAKNGDPNKEKIAQLKALNARYDRLLTGIGQIDDKTNISALTGLLRGELLAAKMSTDQSAILFVRAIGGGENRTTQNLWRGGRLFHNGTAILTYLLFTNNGELVLSDVLYKTTEFVQAK